MSRSARRCAASCAVTPASVTAPSSKVRSATIGRAETSRIALHGVDELLEVVERLDHEDVGAAALEDGRLLREELVADARAAGSPSGPIEPAMKTSRPTVSRASRASLTGVELICLQLVVEEVVRELAPVRAEAVRLDQVGARVDEADVERDDRVSARADWPLRGSAGGDGARDQGAHPAVADDHRPIRKPFFEPIRHLRRL